MSMRVLMFSSDPNVFAVGSPAWDRMRLYESVLEKLEIIRMDRSVGRYVRFWNGYRAARQKLQHERYDIVVAQDIEHALIAWVLSWKYGIPFQMQLHTDIFSPYFWKGGLVNKLRVLCARFLIPRASCIRVVSERIKRSIEMRYPHVELQISVLPVLPSIGDISREAAYKPRYGENYDFIVLMVARLEKEKNIPMAFYVFRIFLQEHPRALLLIVGSGSQKMALKDLSESLGIEKNILFQNNLTREYEIADVLLLTSNYEGYGLVALEALHYGVPVIMTDVGVAGEVVRGGENGLVVPVGDKEKLSAALVRYAKDMVLQEHLKNGAKNTPLPYQSKEEYRDKLKHSWETCVIKK